MAAELAIDLLGIDQSWPNPDSEIRRLGCARSSLTALDAPQVDDGLQNGRSAASDAASSSKLRDILCSDEMEVYVGIIAVTALSWVLMATQIDQEDPDEDFGEPSDLVQGFEQSKADCIQVVLKLLHRVFTSQLPNLDVNVQPLYQLGMSVMCECVGGSLLGDHTMVQLTELWLERFATDPDVPLSLGLCGDDRTEASVVYMLAQLGSSPMTLHHHFLKM